MNKNIIIKIKNFSDLTGINLFKFIDDDFLPVYTTIDIAKLDDYLHKRYPHYKQDMSMNEFIEQEFGKEAKNILLNLI